MKTGERGGEKKVTQLYQSTKNHWVPQPTHITSKTGVIMVPPVANVIKLFTAVIYKFCNKLEHLSLASLSSLV